jgi:cell division septum initiation protein DivIVA
VADNGMKGRVRGLLGAPPAVAEPLEQHIDGLREATGQHQALQVLTLAQRTAEDHVANARRQADKICADARNTAEQIVRDAQAHAQGLAQDADKALAEARAKAIQVAREAQGQAEKAQRAAEEILADARTRADELAKNAQANADELKHQARQRYEDVVGGLAAKREALQRQIEALEDFDREYRSRLSSFLQNQLRALWVDEPQVNAATIEEQPEQTVPAAQHSA